MKDQKTKYEKAKEWRTNNREAWKAIQNRANKKRANEFKMLRVLRDELLQLGVIVPGEEGYSVTPEAAAACEGKCVK